MTQSSLPQTERKRLEQITGIIFDVQRYAVHDGPGVRTNVFFKGCPLRCGWCANPEAQSLQPQLGLFKQQCIACGQFDIPCAAGWGIDTSAGWTAQLRQKYCLRAAVCPTQGIRWIGQQRTASEIMAIVDRDRPFYGDDGGLTLTGGEATLQPDLAQALLRLAQARGISTALETSGQAPWPVFVRLLPHLDHLLFDLKHVNSQIHRAHTGVGNERILANLHQLAARQAPLTIRVALIPGFNTDRASLEGIAGFIRSLNAPLRGIDLLPYHTMGQGKYAALGRNYPWQDQPRLRDDELDAARSILSSCDLPVTVGG